MVTRLERIISAKNSLPEEQRSIFNDLFVGLKTDEQICQERGWTLAEFAPKRDEMLRSLRTVTA